MVKTTYVPNTIGIPTHGVDLWHHELQIGERNPKSPMKPPEGEKRRRKKEREEEERERGPVTLGGPVTSNGLACLSGVMSDDATPVA
jgi:hypothetical protein